MSQLVRLGEPLNRDQIQFSLDQSEFKVSQVDYEESSLQIEKKKYSTGVGAWNSQEVATYEKFVRANRKLLLNSKSRRKFKVFEKMSCKVETRNPIQCRSHHQKMVRKFKIVLSLINYCDSKSKKVIVSEELQTYKKICFQNTDNSISKKNETEVYKEEQSNSQSRLDWGKQMMFDQELIQKLPALDRKHGQDGQKDIWDIELN